MQVVRRIGLGKALSRLKQLGTSRDPELLLKRLASVVFWILLVLPLIGIPLLFLIYSILH